MANRRCHNGHCACRPPIYMLIFRRASPPFAPTAKRRLFVRFPHESRRLAFEHKRQRWVDLCRTTLGPVRPRADFRHTWERTTKAKPPSPFAKAPPRRVRRPSTILATPSRANRVLSPYISFASFYWSAMREDTPVLRRKFARREYAIARLRVATARLIRADSEVEQARATYWVNAWASAIGNLHFHGFAEGRVGHKPRR
ncbi:hypothetical protein LMG24238_00076 [Paraburkholderia sediminicola]|uniref:Uncharacterized protein n=1 Tax=Paraburkholderia sediminicola TaxID=458836 RepID=A0A6J4ZPH8_9BURK|nr:hypothetical protein LMG24238_00076 [Paraburkholderia sediminicola]